MPEITPPPADDKQAPPAPAPADPPKSAEKTFTQSELDAIIAARLARAVPADYEELKALKVAKDAEAEAEKSDIERAKEAAKKADAKAEAAILNANGRLIRAEVIAAAAEAGAVDKDVIVALLAGDASITVDKDGEVSGAAAAVAKLLKDKPFLKGAPKPGATHGEFGGNDPKTRTQEIAELERKANDPTTPQADRRRLYAEARALKLQA